MVVDIFGDSVTTSQALTKAKLSTTTLTTKDQDEKGFKN